MDVNSIIEALGGTSKTAELCKVSEQAVSQWRRNGIPESREMYLRVIRPDAFVAQPEAPEAREASELQKEAA